MMRDSPLSAGTELLQKSEIYKRQPSTRSAQIQTTTTKAMSTQTTTQAPTQTQGRGSGQRGRRGNRGRGGGRGGRGGGGKASVAVQSAAVIAHDKEEEAVAEDAVKSIAKTDDAATADGEDICFICAEPVKYYSVSVCNHRTCHVCSLRLRALYKKLDCTFCKVR